MRILNFLLYLTSVFVTSELIELKNDNFVTLKGVVNGKSVSNWIKQINLLETNIINLYISSPGGSVTHGLNFIDQLKTLQKKGKVITCFSEFAASMAFIIFQSCDNRYVSDSSVLMQHQMSLSIGGNYFSINNYLNYIEEINTQIIENQAKRINMTTEKFISKITNDWWLSGKEAVKQNVADKLVNVNCEKLLFDQKEILVVDTTFGEIKLHYFKCPIITQPFKIENNNKNKEKINYYELLKYYITSFAINELKNKNFILNFD